MTEPEDKLADDTEAAQRARKVATGKMTKPATGHKVGTAPRPKPKGGPGDLKK